MNAKCGMAGLWDPNPGVEFSCISFHSISLLSVDGKCTVQILIDYKK